jgi:hypothetical protein
MKAAAAASSLPTETIGRATRELSRYAKERDRGRRLRNSRPRQGLPCTPQFGGGKEMPHAEAHLCSRSLPRSCGLPDASTERGHCYRCRCWCGCRRPSWCRCRRRCWGRRNCTRWAPEPGLLLRPEPARAACLQPLRSTAGKALCVNESPAARRAFCCACFSPGGAVLHAHTQGVKLALLNV